MATYNELLSVAANNDLQSRMRVAVLVAADTIRLEAEATPNHANRMLWAKKAYLDPVSIAPPLLWATLVQNRAASLGALTSATDAVLQTAVDAAVNLFANGT